MFETTAQFSQEHVCQCRPSFRIALKRTEHRPKAIARGIKSDLAEHDENSPAQFLAEYHLVVLGASTSSSPTNSAASPAISAIDEFRHVTTGASDAMASSTGMPNPS